MFSTLYDTYFDFQSTLLCCLQFLSIWTSLKFFLSSNGLNVGQMMKPSSKWIEDMMRNRENAGSQPNSTCPLMFSTCFFNRVVNPLPNKPWFLRVCSKGLLITQWDMEKSLITSNFSFSHIVFYPFEDLSAIFIGCKIVTCKHFEFGSV